MKKRQGIPYLTVNAKLRIVIIIVVAISIALAYYLFLYHASHTAFNLITKSDTQWNCVNYDAQFYVSEEQEIEGSIVINGNTLPLWIGYLSSTADLYACDASTVSQPNSDDFLIAKTRFRAYNGRLHFIFVEDKMGLGLEKLVFEEAR